jgi:hypothetical protein
MTHTTLTLASTVTRTDEQLRAAVAESLSWQAVARKLGYPVITSTTRRHLQKRAATLGLDTSHFTGSSRRWSDRQLIEASPSASSWEELCRRLSVSDYAEMRTLIKGHAVRLGIDLDHLSSPGTRGPIHSVPIAELPFELEHLRRAAPALAMSWFIGRGCTPALPIEPEPYDLIVSSPTGFQRVQVKSTTCFAKGEWTVTVGHRTDKNTPLVPYTDEEVDLFFIVDGDLNMYLLPLAAIGGRVRITLRPYQIYVVGNATGILSVS